MRVEYIDHMGTDLSCVNAARVSFSKESKEFEDKDEKLIKYLAKHDHWTPFAHTSISLRVGAPVPMRTQCFKHKQGLVENEESRRYISSEPELYVPDTFRNAPLGSIKQGSSGEHYNSELWKARYIVRARGCIKDYTDMIAEGICPEQARFILPQGVYVNWIWTGNLYSFANFYNKRSKPETQLETRLIADKVSAIIEPLFPVSWKALTDEK